MVVTEPVGVAAFEAREIAVAEVWADGWRGPSVIRIGEGGFTYVGPITRGTAPRPITVLPGFTDWHVHLGLIDPAKLIPGGIARVLDLGWIPAEAAKWVTTVDRVLPETSIAGALLAPPGGYPGRSSWAPADAVIELGSAHEATVAVARMKSLGATVIKLTLNSVAGPTFDDALLAAIIATAHAHELPVVAHAEGAGQAERAAAAGVDLLAHTPFSERLTDATLAAMAGSIAWISTLDIHGWGAPTTAFEIAVDNARRFAVLGGEIRYGTDLGNGPLPVGVNVRELRALAGAGLGADALVRSIVAPATSARLGSRVSVVDTLRPHGAVAMPGWLESGVVHDVASFAELAGG